MFSSTYADVFTGDERWRALETPEGELYAWDDASTYVRLPPYFDGMPREPEPVADVEGARCLVLGRRLGHDRSHLAGGRDPARLAGREVPDRARRRAPRVQLLRRPPRQPRGDGARHVRERPAQEPPRARQRGHVDGAPARRRGGDDLRGRRALPRRGRADDRDRGQGVRLRLVARLGGEGPEPARRARRDRGLVRADPPLEPPDDGNRAAPVHAGRERRVARADRPRGVLDHRARRRRRRRGDGARRRQGVPRPRSGSTRRASGSTSATAASSSTCCGGC